MASMVKVAVCVDNGSNQSTTRAFDEALKHIDKAKDEVFLVNVYSSWDYLNEEKNAGKMSLSQVLHTSTFTDFQYERLCASEGITVAIATQLESDSPMDDLAGWLEDMHMGIHKAYICLPRTDVVYIGRNAFTATANEDNVIFSFFSNIKR